MSYQDQDYDNLAEELEAPDLMADFKAIYQTDQTDRQSLIRIRTRLQNLPSNTAIAETPISLSANNRASERGKIEREKSTFLRTQRLNKVIALLVAASMIGAFAMTLTWFHHPIAGQNVGRSTQVTQNNTQPVPQPLPLEKVILANPTTAWLPTAIHLPGGGEVNGPLLRTVDAGKTWHDITPPQIKFDISYSSYTLKDGKIALKFDTSYSLYALKDGKTAWILDKGSQEETLYQTHDGGQTWQKLSLPQGIFIQIITFLDQKHSWFIGRIQKANEPLKLFATTDGGQTWQQRSTPVLLQAQTEPSQMQFIDAQIGWLSVVTQSGQQILFVTHTAGSSWSPLPVAENIHAKGSFGFKFVSANHGYLMLNHYQQNTGKNDTSYFYETNDGGKTWQNNFFKPIVPTNITSIAYINEQQIQVQQGNTIAIYTRNSDWWVQSSSHTLSDGQLLFTTFVSTTTGLGIVDYSKYPSNTDPGGDRLSLVKTTDSGKTWTKVSFSLPIQTVTAYTMFYTMAYMTYPGWTYDTADEDLGPKTFTPTGGQSSSGNPAPLTAKKWLVRFQCMAPTADLTLNGKHFSAQGCDKHPISTIVSFDTAQSIQTVKVEVQKQTSWLVVLEACTNEKQCLANIH